METSKLDIQQQGLDALQKVVYSKLDYSWLLVVTYLDIMRGIGCISRDKEFNRLFSEMRDYVDKKITTKCVGEINDIFVVAEQIIPTS